jgi:integrase
VRDALKIAPYVFVRPGELRHAEWAEIDFEKALVADISPKNMTIDLSVTKLLKNTKLVVLKNT